MRVGYFTAYYPATSHTFIRREIRALEAQGTTVIRYALRVDPQGLVDPEDAAEEKLTRLILHAGVLALIRSISWVLVRRPWEVVRIFLHAAKIGYRSDRGIVRHLAFAVEAIVLAEWCQQDAIQHLHTHFGTGPTVIAMLTHELTHIPFSFTAHGSEEFEKAPLLSLDVKLRHAAFAACVSSFGRSQLMRWSPPELWSKIALVRCGVDQSYLEMPIQPPPDAPRLVCVGRIGEHKGQLILVAAAARLRAAGIDFSIVLVGDGPMRHQVEDAIDRNGLGNHISITGWVPGERVKEEILAARAMVLPSFSENMPVVIMEAMALGRPVISTYIAGIPELVQPGITGWLVPASDEAALANAIGEALTTTVQQLAAMGAAGRAVVKRRHDAFSEAKMLRDLFESSTSR